MLRRGVGRISCIVFNCRGLSTRVDRGHPLGAKLICVGALAEMADVGHSRVEIACFTLLLYEGLRFLNQTVLDRGKSVATAGLADTHAQLACL